jgi:glycosyltransferase involved in cell wall biosynthesis
MPKLEEITLCMGAYNSSDVLPKVLDGMLKQGIKTFICADNESTDESVELIKKWLPEAELFSFKHTPDFVENCRELRRQMAKRCKTKFLFYLDSDVVLPDGIIEQMANYWDTAEKPGCVSAKYGAVGAGGHIQFGATLVETAIAQQMKLDDKTLCDCLNFKKEMEAMGLILYQPKEFVATHLRETIQSTSVNPVEPEIIFQGNNVYVVKTEVKKTTESVSVKKLQDEILNLKRDIAQRETMIYYINKAQKEVAVDGKQK